MESRRGLLKLLAFGLLALISILSTKPRQLLERARAWVAPLAVGPKLDGDGKRGEPTGQELSCLLALVETLLPSGVNRAQAMSFMVSHIRERTLNVGGYLNECKAAVRLLDDSALKMAGKKFADLPLSERERALSEIIRESWFRRVLALFSDKAQAALRLRELVIKDLIEAFYRSPSAWQSIGYTPRGGCAEDVRAYTRPPA